MGENINYNFTCSCEVCKQNRNDPFTTNCYSDGYRNTPFYGIISILQPKKVPKSKDNLYVDALYWDLDFLISGQGRNWAQEAAEWVK